jgi:hypothetical protein
MRNASVSRSNAIATANQAGKSLLTYVVVKLFVIVVTCRM